VTKIQNICTIKNKIRKTIYKVTSEKDKFTIIRKRKQSDCPDSENKIKKQTLIKKR